MGPTIETLMRRNLLEIFGERDEARRRRAIKDVMAEDVIFSDPKGHHVGHDAINTAVTALLAGFPDFVFAELTPPQVISGAGRVRWGFGPNGASPQVTGMDVAVVREGKIVALYAFIDQATAAR